MKRLALLLLACSVLSIEAAPSCQAQTQTYRYNLGSGFRIQPQSSNTKVYPLPFNQFRRYPWWRPTPTQPTMHLNPGIDPAAQSIAFRVLSKTSQFAGRVEISAVVKNVGTSTYQSRAGAQAAYLYEVPLGSRSGRVVASRDFTQLASGQEVKLTYVRNWNSSSPGEGEFPPDYKLVIVYDPDIAIDGNRQNDDVNRNNNQTTKSGSAINQMLR